ncbi:hypothetical protein [Roseospirillum parvum]|uniref:Cysteine rich repeat-containing protein n=1 Tax=Roseospirillum parvum TaxID=83401 RepID=A0A1G7WUH8_9PROT|nr:hypothetical protein [Roseospirillum parvum]SDG75605.1 hypothetical protein SAMN05421742_102324 [Roseospirillum parvum]
MRPFPRFRPLAAVAVVAAVVAGAALPAAAYQSNMACEMDYRRCERDAQRQARGDDPCSAYSRCQAVQQCEASRCACLRTGGHDDPALKAEAQAVCFAVIRPHGGNSCDRYIDACIKWREAETEAPVTAPGNAPDGPSYLPPEALPR